MTIHPGTMRRSHLLLAAAVGLAGIAALIGNRTGTPAEVQGAPLMTAGADRPAAGSGAAGRAPSAADATPARSATAAAVAQLVDLDRLTLTPDGEHYEAILADGRHAELTLDPALQALAEKLLVEARAPRGAIVAMAPDGRILALAGRRGDDHPPKRGEHSVASFDWRLATDVWAPAASVFKLVTASALVAAGVDPSDKVCFHGGIRSVSESNLRDDKRDSRCETLTYGVAHSNNAILGKLAFQKLEPDALPGGELLGVAGAMELPTAHDLSFAQAAAGFVGSRLSAMGGALLAATFADDGEQPIPRIIASIDGVAQVGPARRRAVTAEIAKAVGKMMTATCEIGSASRSFGKHQPIRVAGKTGTLTRTEPFYMEHSWFVGYAPIEQPQIVVSIVLGNPENWHLRGHEAARRLIDRALRPASGPSGHDKDRGAKLTSARRAGW